MLSNDISPIAPYLRLRRSGLFSPERPCFCRDFHDVQIDRGKVRNCKKDRATDIGENGALRLEENISGRKKGDTLEIKNNIQDQNHGCLEDQQNGEEDSVHFHQEAHSDLEADGHGEKACHKIQHHCQCLAD